MYIDFSAEKAVQKQKILDILAYLFDRFNDSMNAEQMNLSSKILPNHFEMAFCVNGSAQEARREICEKRATLLHVPMKNSSKCRILANIRVCAIQLREIWARADCESKPRENSDVGRIDFSERFYSAEIVCSPNWHLRSTARLSPIARSANKPGYV